MEAFVSWLELKLWILYYNLQLTPEEKAENKAALKEWERDRAAR
jgi:hypothetical protein